MGYTKDAEREIFGVRRKIWDSVDEKLKIFGSYKGKLETLGFYGRICPACPRQFQFSRLSYSFQNCIEPLLVQTPLCRHKPSLLLKVISWWAYEAIICNHNILCTCCVMWATLHLLTLMSIKEHSPLRILLSLNQNVYGVMCACL